MPIIEQTKLDNSGIRIVLTMKPEDYRPEFEEQVRKERKNLSIKGFRKGQAPDAIVYRAIGHGTYARHIMDKLNTYLFDYLKENKIEFVGLPVNAEGVDADLNFEPSKKNALQKFAVDVAAVEATEVDYTGISTSFTFPKPMDWSENIEKIFENATKSSGNREDATDNIREGDFVKMEVVEVDADNIPVEDGWATTVTLLVNHIKDEEFLETLKSNQINDVVFFNPRKVEEFDTEEAYRKMLLNIPREDNRAIGDWFRGEIVEVKRIMPVVQDEQFFKSQFGEGVSTKEEAATIAENYLNEIWEDRALSLAVLEYEKVLVQSSEIKFSEEIYGKYLMSNHPKEKESENAATFIAEFMDYERRKLIREGFIKDDPLNDEDVNIALNRYLQNLSRNYGIDPEMLWSIIGKGFMDKRANQILMFEQAFWIKTTDAIANRLVVNSKFVSKEDYKEWENQALEQINKDSDLTTRIFRAKASAETSEEE